MQRRNFDTLDGLRGIAALCVLMWHFEPLHGKHFWSAYLAVDLFFAMSGVVIAFAYEDRLKAGWSAGRFLLTRIIRLWPLYLLGSALGAVALAGTILLRDGTLHGGGFHAWHFKPLIGDALRALFLVPDLRLDDATAFPLNRNAWSLACEFLVNIGYAFGGYRLGNRTLLGIAAVCGAVVAWGAFYYARYDSALNLGGLCIHLGVGVARAGFAFPIGILIFRWWRAGVLPRVRVPAPLVVAAFLILLFVAPGEGPRAPLGATLAVLIGCPAIVALAIQAEPPGWLRPAARLSGRISYPLYALQDGFYLFALGAVSVAGKAAVPAYAAAAIAALVAALIADRWYDVPVRDALTHWTGLRRKSVLGAPGL